MSFMLTFPRQIAVFPSADIQRKQKTEEASYENDQEIDKLRADITVKQSTKSTLQYSSWHSKLFYVR